ncbi:MAG: Na+/H+ antiporter subunit E [Bryobacteraceae bacterium]
MTLMLRLAIAWIAFLGLWLVFAFQVTLSELIVGGVASAMAVAFGWITFRVAPPCFEPRLRWLVQIWRLVPMIPIDLWLLLKHLIRQIAGKSSRSSFEVTSFQAVGGDCHAAAQRALAILFVSTTPNSVVLDIDCQGKVLFFHQMEPAAVPELLRRLEN